MAITVAELFDSVNLKNIYKVKWSILPTINESGVYVVSTSPCPNENGNTSPSPKFDNKQIQAWLETTPNMTIDGAVVTATKLKERLSEFWLPEENILYIGKAPKRKNEKGITQRVQEYYRHKIGMKSPHRGGFWLKALKNIDDFTVYYYPCENADSIEFQILAYFSKNVDLSSVRGAVKEFPLPFANIRHQIDKNHGLKKQTV